MDLGLLRSNKESDKEKPSGAGGLSCFWDGRDRPEATWVAGGSSERAGSTVAGQKEAVAATFYRNTRRLLS